MGTVSQSKLKISRNPNSSELALGLERIDTLRLVSIAEARRIMGAQAKKMTDKEIEDAIYNLTIIARTFIQQSFTRA